MDFASSDSLRWGGQLLWLCTWTMILTPCWCEAFGFWLVGIHPLAEFSPIIDMATSVRSLVDPEDNTDLVVSWVAWEVLLTWLVEADDQAIVRDWLHCLKARPDQSGVLLME